MVQSENPVKPEGLLSSPMFSSFASETGSFFADAKHPKVLVFLEDFSCGGDLLAQEIFSKYFPPSSRFHFWDASLLSLSQSKALLQGKSPALNLNPKNMKDSVDFICLKESQFYWFETSKNLKEIQRLLSIFIKKPKKKLFFVFLCRESEESLEKACEEKRLTKTLKNQMLKVSYRLPSLKERREELPGFIEMLIHQKDPSQKIDELAIKRLGQYDWPGNFLELNHCLEESIRRSQGETITIDHLNIPVTVASGDDLFPQILPPEKRQRRIDINS